jgi:stage V sporulation protein B
MLNGAMILTISMALVKVIGFFYKMPLNNIFLMEGRGVFNSAFNLYSPVYAIAITGLPIAVARMVSERVALGKFRDVREIQKVAHRLFLFVGVAGLLVLLALAYPYAVFYCTRGVLALPAILAIAPAIFFCCAMSIYRGYYEGLRNMIPTAVSQVLEALCKLILGIFLASLCMRLGAAEYKRSGTVFGQSAASEAAANSLLYPWAAAASIIGITLGTVVGLVYLVLRHKIRGDGITREQLVNSAPAEPRKKLRHEMITIAIPMVLSSVVLNLTNLIDTTNVQRILINLVANHSDVIERIYADAFRLAGTEKDGQASYISGIYGAMLDFRTLIPTIVTALGVSALPAISAAWALKDKGSVQRTINSVIRISLMISLPAGFGMAVLYREIPMLFFEKSNPGMTEHAAPILLMFALSTALMSVSAPITNLLQGIGRTDVPVKSLLVGAVVKIASNFILVGNPEINILGAPIGSILCYVAIVTINLGVLLKVSRVKLHLTTVLWKPLFCSGISAAAAWAAKGLMQLFAAKAGVDGRLLQLLVMAAAIGAAVLVYAISMLLTHAVTEEDLEMLPKGKKIGKTLAKYGLLG